MQGFAELLKTHSAPGRIEWIGLRSERKADLQSVESADVKLDGLAGDHARPGKRALTLIQEEHFHVIAALCGQDIILPKVLRRNVVVSGINLTALRHNRLRLGTCEIEFTAPCAPCSRMEAALGKGGYNAMRGHGGWCAQVLKPGRIVIGDTLVVIRD
ncbi:MOSC domain protein [Roseovarius albus]|uniref:MOSC domain protein n=1 Tax=Roseovarius albus TaxID=1247867 RepID=A0A1X6YYD1_9RHOB|nr:MOSC domain-containing protein [Roseovarius albus]SLN35397.1 MOSC domain protein [Roseovarius albus]